MKKQYSFQMKENMARASARDIHISTKHAIEIFNYIRGRPLSQAKRLLQSSIDKKKPIPVKKFTDGVGHKAGIASGRYYEKACSEILKVLDAAEANARNKGLSVADLKLSYAVAQKAGKQWHYGRKRRSVFKNTHLEVGLEEIKDLNKEKSTKKVNK